MKPQLLVLNQMAGPLTWEWVEDFAQRGGPVALFTGHPDTLQKPAPPGVRVDPAVPYDRRSYPRRVISWLRYWLQAFFWIRRFDPDIPLLVFSNPPFLPWLAFLCQKLRGTRYSVMVHDIYPDLLVGLHRVQATNPIVRVWRRINRTVYENAELVMTLGEFMADRLAEQFDPQRTPAGRIAVVPPWADTTTIRPRNKSENWFAKGQGVATKTTVMYSGNMGEGHDLETLLEAAQRLRERDDLHFLFIGAGPKWSLVEQTIEAQELPNVTLLGWQPEEVVPFSLSSADIAVVSLEPGMEGMAIPSKAFSFLAAGAAMLIISNPAAELARLVDDRRCGWSISPGSVDDLITVLDRAMSGELEPCKDQSRRTAEQLGSRHNSHSMVDLVCTHHELTAEAIPRA